MTNFKKYFSAHLKANIKPFLYILIVVLALTFLIGYEAQPTQRYDYAARRSVQDYNSTLFIPITVLCILTYVLPVMEFSFFKKRIDLDCAYSLPISRRAMGTVHYLVGLIMLCGAFTASYLVNFMLLLSRGPGWFNFTPMLAHYFLSLLLGVVMYAVMVFVFNEANTKGDGIWFMILYTFIFFLLVWAFGNLTGKWYDGSPGLSWGVIGRLTTNYQYLVELDSTNKADFWQTPENVGWFVFWTAAGIASAVGFFFTFGKRRMEKTEEISDSYFGFRVLIPLYAVSGMIAFPVSDVIIFWVIIELLALLGYTIYRRGFHYKKSDIAILCLLLLFLFQ